MYWKMLAIPLVGAAIGYVTNWIAVKMLFRPRKEVRLWGKRLPFTPGVIPRGQKRLARAVGRAAEEQLLTQEALEKVLLSEEKISSLKETVQTWLDARRESEETLRQMAGRFLPEEALEEYIDAAEDKMTDKVFAKIKDMEPGKMVAGTVLEAAKAKLEESMFGAMLGGAFLDPIARQVEEMINAYVAEHGRPLVEQMVWEASENIQKKTGGELLTEIENSGIDLPALAAEEYGKLVKEKLAVVLRAINLSAIVEEKINAMDVEEVEELILSMMKKELGTVVNLGAVIGLVLGLINVLILYL